ncbi:MAG TPA: agmatinase [Candidatus Nanoarchaeia archaeon]|nr:agmatinase [Candidatus Nanoarchaeia archaeon]
MKYNKTHFTFTGQENPELEESDVLILPVPYDCTASYNSGSKKAPRAIINASAEMEFFDLETKRDVSSKIHTLPEVFPSCKSPERMSQVIEGIFDQILALKKFPVMIGGDHSVSIGAIRAMSKAHKNLSVVQIDAHLDLRDEYQESKYSHACTMRRIREIGCDAVQVGIRTASEEEMGYVTEQKIENSIFFEKISENDVDRIVDAIKNNDVYITIDVDGFDASVFPGTGTPEPDGISWSAAMKLFRAIFRKKNVVGFDIVEVKPQCCTTISEDNAARMIYKLVSYKL